MKYEEKLQKLEKIIKGYGSIAVSFSGGVDSTFLLLFGQKILGKKIMAITASAPNFDPDEITYAKVLCENHGIRHLVVDLSKPIMDAFSQNSPERCYVCKKAIFSQVVRIVSENYPGTVVVDGTNMDDMADYRPGHKAIQELNIASPIKEAGLTKDEVRRGLKDLGGDIWDKPAAACLASRIPYGDTITEEKLSVIHAAEKAIKTLGFRQVRVRHHGNLARIEVGSAEQDKFLEPEIMAQVNAQLKNLGFLYVTLDLAGYKMGSLNQEIEK